MRLLRRICHRGGCWLVLAALLAAPLAAQWIPLDPVRSVRPSARGLDLRTQYGVLRLRFCTPSLVHVRYSPNGKFPAKPHYMVLPQHWAPVVFHWTETPQAVVLTSAQLRITVTKASGVMVFADAQGQPLYQDTSHVMTPAVVNGEKTYHALDYAGIYGSTESFYGLGQHQAGVWDYHGETVELTQRNTNIAIPMLISSHGYGIFWDNASPTWFNNRLTHAIYWRSLVADTIDYYFCYGPQLSRVVAEYRQLTGQAPMFGKWAYGFWQSKNRYESQAQILKIAAQYRRLRIPVDNLVQDWFWWTKMGSFRFKPQAYPDPAAMVRQLHAEHFHIMISVWPYFYPGTPAYRALKKNGWLIAATIAPSYFRTQMALYDPTAAGARHLFWREINQNLFRIGFDAWWLDEDEPGVATRDLLWHHHIGIGSGARFANLYPLFQARGVYDGQRRVTSQKRVFILSRSAYAGSQRYGITAWSGDVLSDWEAFRRQIPAGLNYSISGLPYWTTDIGGFFIGHPNEPAYRQLFVRWFEYGVFCPIFRTHGTRVPDHNELWSYGRQAQAILTRYDRLRYRLLPYIYSLAWQVTAHAGTIMRPLVMAFPRDRIADTTGNQFLFGPFLMVAPVTRPDVSQWPVYLPKATWYDFWTGQALQGGRYVYRATPLGTEPLYVRAGAILPLGPNLQYAMQKPWNPIELRVYRGANGHFTLYNDDGLTYDYEHGAYATIPITWDDQTQTLTIGVRRGSFPGMLARRTFDVVFVSPGHGTGIRPSQVPDRVVSYDGTQVQVRASGPPPTQ
ncbi:MAG: glycoside hydrolase family 31 protein [Terriglobales bacterium]